MHIYLDENALYLFNEGANAYAYTALGCHRLRTEDGRDVYRFAVWAPNARAVSVVGSFNGWNPEAEPMRRCGSTGVWQLHSEAARAGDTYKFAIESYDGDLLYKADPFAFYSQQRPETASVVVDMDNYVWRDGAHMHKRRGDRFFDRPVNIYEVHAGSWTKDLQYADMGEQLADYVRDMGYTHISFMPLMEHMEDESWGYRATGYYAVSSRYGTPEQFKYLVDCCHAAGLYVLMDWPCAAFPKDAHGLRFFDGTPLFEPADTRRSAHAKNGMVRFDFARSEVQSFLISNAVFWLQEYHIDGLRLEGLGSVLYHDFGRRDGDWLPNRYGGRENLEGIAFLRRLGETLRRECPGTLFIADEDADFPLATVWPDRDGLGFDFKWNRDYVRETLFYMGMDSFFRKDHHERLTHPLDYAFRENHVLPFSHKEVRPGRGSLIARMHGPYEDQFRQLRLLLMYQFAHPGKKLNFMGNEIAQFAEWNFRESLEWFLLDYPSHADFQRFMRALNHFYLDTPALWERDTDYAGFRWVREADALHSTLAFLRFDAEDRALLCLFNFTPVDHPAYRLEMPQPFVLTKAMSGVDSRSLRVSSRQGKNGMSGVELPLWGYEAAYFYVEPKAEPGRAARQEGEKDAPRKKGARKART